MSRPEGEARGLRLILSDANIGGGQVMKTFPQKFLRIDQVLNALLDNQVFGFAHLCQKRGVKPTALSPARGNLSIIGMDGPRRVPIRSDGALASFLSELQRPGIPSLEVSIVKPVEKRVPETEHPASPAAKDAKDQRGSQPRDVVERLEDENFKLARSNDKVDRRCTELERLRMQDLDDVERMVNHTKGDLEEQSEILRNYMQKQIDDLRGSTQTLTKDLADLKKFVRDLDRQNRRDHESFRKDQEHLGTQVRAQLEDMEGDISSLRAADERLAAEDAHQQKILNRLEGEVTKLQKDCVTVPVWEAENKRIEEAYKGEVAGVRMELKGVAAIAEKNLAAVKEELVAADTEISKALRENCTRIDGELARLETDLQDGLLKASDALEEARQELHASIQGEVTALSDSVTQKLKEMSVDLEEKDMTIHKKVDILEARTEKTFQGISDRMEEMVKVERARLNTIEKDIQESSAKMRSDHRSQVDRLRGDSEKEAARLDADLGDLHAKHDVIKQEINFFNLRLLEQRDWAQRQLAETATATRAAQVDAQEAQASSSKMLHALRDDAVGFREKMAKYISLLQHSSDSQGDAINSLETARARMRLELDALSSDHKAYTCDMDGWANDVRIKVERLFRAMEPPRCEWRLERATKRSKELKRPLAVKSPSFALKGARGIQMEFYPNGTQNSSEGKAILRLYMPPSANVRFQVWIGTLSEGAMDFAGGPQGNLSVDLPFEKWQEQIREDDSVIISMVIVLDHNDVDESLQREVRIETQ